MSDYAVISCRVMKCPYTVKYVNAFEFGPREFATRGISISYFFQS